MHRIGARNEKSDYSLLLYLGCSFVNLKEAIDGVDLVCVLNVVCVLGRGLQ